MARSLFLFSDLSEFYSVLSKKKSEGRSGDISTMELQQLIALVQEDPNTSVLTMADTGPAGEGLFSPHDVDINGTQEVMVGGAARNPLGDFCTLAYYMARMKRVDGNKMDAMSHDNLAQEAKSQALLQQVQVTSKNCSVFNIYQNRYKTTGRPSNSTFVVRGTASAGNNLDNLCHSPPPPNTSIPHKMGPENDRKSI